jgi:hypothetical protein
MIYHVGSVAHKITLLLIFAPYRVQTFSADSSEKDKFRTLIFLSLQQPPYKTTPPSVRWQKKGVCSSSLNPPLIYQLFQNLLHITTLYPNNAMYTYKGFIRCFILHFVQ